MTVFLGDAGRVELLRTSAGQSIQAVVLPGDVSEKLDSFSFADLDDNSAIITGDLLLIKSTDRRLLEWIDPSGWDDGQQHRDIKAYVNINEAGMIRLYREFVDAVNDNKAARLQMVPFAGAGINIEVTVSNIAQRCLGRVVRYEFNSERNAVDVSQLGEEFRNVYGTSISGSGSIEAFFDYNPTICENGEPGLDDAEMAIYLHQLVVRQQLGSAFKAELYVITRTSGKEKSHQIWHEFDAIVTNCGLTVAAGETIRSTINFVSTGPIHLRTQFISNYLLQENDGLIELERLQEGSALLVEQTE